MRTNGCDRMWPVAVYQIFFAANKSPSGMSIAYTYSALLLLLLSPA